MSVIKTEAIVLRRADYGENAKIIGLLTANGLYDAVVYGCKTAKSTKLSSTEPFSYGEYVLLSRRDSFTVDSFEAKEHFFPIRTDFDRLIHGEYWMDLCATAAQPGESTLSLFKMLLYSLTMLAYGEYSPQILTTMFLMQFCRVQGYMPQFENCRHCGKQLDAPCFFSVSEGWANCSCCENSGELLNAEELQLLREAQTEGAYILSGKKSISYSPDPQIISRVNRLLSQHLTYRLEKQFPIMKFL